MFIYEVRQALENGEVHINLQLVHACKAAKQWKRKIMNNQFVYNQKEKEEKLSCKKNQIEAFSPAMHIQGLS